MGNSPEIICFEI